MTTDIRTGFPADFTWGVSSSSYQIEGATIEDGRGESIWDRFCTIPGKVRNGECGDIACDHYHRYPEDIGLMRELGITAYRFSISWPRILPTGHGSLNQRGLDFYDRLVDELLEAEIEPFVTLYHWDLPQALEDAGGWTNRNTVDAFLEYTRAVANRLGDRVHNWITHNEPWCTAWLGYGIGEHAPGRTGESAARAASHHVLLSHGQAVGVIRQYAAGARVGITLNLYPVYPASEAPEDRAAARIHDGLRNRWYLDPVFRGRYPEDILRLVEQHMPDVLPGDLDAIAAPIDFLGVNYYTRNVIRAGKNDQPVHVHPDNEYTSMGWEVYPDGLYDVLQRVHAEHTSIPLYITENGASYTDVRTHEGAVRDPERLQYLQRHLGTVSRAIRSGMPVAGYFAWSLLDNFEWAHGYNRRFGLVYVDYPTLERIPKASFYWYRDFIAGAAAARAVA
jgi:beta-glucosidase